MKIRKFIIYTLVLILLAGLLPVTSANTTRVYINFKDIAAIENFILIEENIYKKAGCENTPDIIIRLDLNERRIYKSDSIAPRQYNDFRFPLDFELRDGQVYIEQRNAASVFNVNFILENGRVIGAEPLRFDPHSWISMARGLVAHAGGTFGGDRRVQDTNSREAVVWSYNRGHRIFELDFRLTSDNKLAAVHNWHGHIPGRRGRLSSAEWKDVRIWTVFTSMMLECVLDIMLINRDMFIITDTKSFEYSTEEMILQFEILVETAKRKDPALLDRIIPQIYNQEMYDIVMAQHEFISIIYTLYASPDSNSEVVDFVSQHDNIRVVTMAPVRGTPEFIRALRSIGKQIYFFTVNDLDELLNYRRAGVRGFYTSFIFPSDLS